MLKLEELLHCILGLLSNRLSINAGFLLLATQNPISMAGRQATSQAIKRRVLFHEFKTYTGTEMKDILVNRYENVPLSTIQKLEANTYHKKISDSLKMARLT